jgi:hypothetical protein
MELVIPAALRTRTLRNLRVEDSIIISLEISLMGKILYFNKNFQLRAMVLLI